VAYFFVQSPVRRRGSGVSDAFTAVDREGLRLEKILSGLAFF